MHPLLLHALAATWSLDTARGRLAERARVEAAQIAAEQAETAHDGIRSTVYGARTGSGGHGDPAAATALLGVDRPPRINRWQQLGESVDDTLRWLAGKLAGELGATHPHPLAYLRQLVITGTLQPGQAQNLTMWLRDADQRIRQPLALGPDRWRLPGAPECPACRQSLLYVQTSGPGEVWTVVCGAACTCTGDDCPCGMPVRMQGVGHIWDHTAPHVAAALTTTSQPTA